MFLRYSGGVYTDIIRFHTPFIMFVYNEDLPKDTSLTIIPSWYKRDVNHVVKFLGEGPLSGLTFVETFHQESYDFANSLNIDYGNHYEYHNERLLPVMISVGKDGKLIDTSYGKCYCLATLLELVASIDIKLLEPTSISES
jgi:hypothetical protein